MKAQTQWDFKTLSNFSKFPFWLVIRFIFGFNVKHYLKEMKIWCQKFVEIVQECRFRFGLRQIELTVGHSCRKRNNLDRFQLITTHHLKFGSVPFSTNYARHCFPRTDNQGNTIVRYFVRYFGQEKPVFLISRLSGCSWPLQLCGGREVIQDVRFFVEGLQTTCGRGHWLPTRVPSRYPTTGNSNTDKHVPKYGCQCPICQQSSIDSLLASSLMH